MSLPTKKHHSQATGMSPKGLIEECLRPVGEDVIGQKSTIEDIVRVLSSRGCPDITSRINLGECTSNPVNGGGYCDVFRGRLNSGTVIAIKTWRVFENAGVDSSHANLLKDTTKELYHWSKLRHPNMLPLLGLALFRGRISMVSEWMENGSLPSYIRKNPEVDRVRLCMDICAGLCYMHSHDMVHGDLKGANVVVSPIGVAMITDFGSVPLKEITLKFTYASYTGGFTLRWAAPELVSPDAVTYMTNKSSDVWAYGMEILTGEVPFADKSDIQVIYSLAGGQHPTKPSGKFSDELWDIITLCWHRDPSKRPSMAIMKDHLTKLTLGQPQRPISAPKRGDTVRLLSTCVRAVLFGLSSALWITKSALPIPFEAFVSPYKVRRLEVPRRDLNPVPNHVMLKQFTNVYYGITGFGGLSGIASYR